MSDTKFPIFWRDEKQVPSVSTRHGVVDLQICERCRGGFGERMV